MCTKVLFLCIAAALAVPAFAAQSTNWQNTVIETDPDWWSGLRAGVAFDRNGLVGAASVLAESGEIHLKLYRQVRASNGTISWATTTYPTGISSFGLISDVDLDFDASGGAGIVLSYKGSICAPNCTPPAIAVLYYYIPQGGTVTVEEVVDVQELAEDPRTIGDHASIAFEFDNQGRGVLAYLMNWIEVPVEDGENFRYHRVHYAVRGGSGVWDIHDIDNPIGELCAVNDDVAMFVDENATTLPYNVVYTEHPRGEAACDPNSVKFVRADANGNISAIEAIAATIGNKEIRRLGLAGGNGVSHLVWEHQNLGPLDSEYVLDYTSKSGSGAWTTPLTLTLPSSALFLGNLAMAGNRPHLTFRIGDTVYVSNGPDWPAAGGPYTRAESSSGAMHGLPNIAGRTRNGLDTAPDLAVVYDETTRGMVATGCSGSSTATAGASAAGSLGDLLLFALTAAILGGAGLRFGYARRRA